MHISTYADGGAGTAAYRIHESLLESGINSNFLCLEMNGQKHLKCAYEFEKPRYNVFERALRKVIRLSEKYYSFKKLFPHKFYKKSLENIRYKLNCDVASLPYCQYNILEHPLVKNADIIHLHWVAGFIDYVMFFNLNIKPVIWTLHDLNPALGLYHYEDDMIRNNYISAKLDAAIIDVKRKAILKRKCKLYLAFPSLWLLNKAKSSLVLNSIEGCSVHYPLNTEVFKPKSSNLREKLGVPDTNKILLFVSQTVVHYRKGFDLLMDALSQVKDDNITLLIIGYAGELKIVKSSTIYLGHISDNELLSEYYSLADAFIIPSREDNLPNVMLESLACGTPIISFNVGGMQEVVEDYFNGLKAKERNAESLKKIIEDFIIHKNLFDAFEIRKFALKKFSNDVIANKYTEIYKSQL